MVAIDPGDAIALNLGDVFIMGVVLCLLLLGGWVFMELYKHSWR